MSRISRQHGFTTIEMLIAIFILTTGILSLIGTIDMSRRLTSLSEMKEAASHVAEQKIEEIRALDYDRVALDGMPATSATKTDPGYYVNAGAGTYRWSQKADAPAPNTEPLLICATVSATCPEVGVLDASAESWSDGRVKGKVHRYVTAVNDSQCTATVCPDSADYKRVTVAVTVENRDGPENPILVSALIADPDAAPAGTVVDGGQNPLSSPDTQCNDGGVLVDCVQAADGRTSSFYLYDTPATSGARQEITGSHATHPTVAPTGRCDGISSSGCPVPDLMAPEPSPSPDVTPTLYNYSSEVSGVTWPGGAVIRRDTGCADTPSDDDNTKGHMWVTAPLSAPMTVTGSGALSVATTTVNGVSAAATLCVRFYNVPGSIENLITSPPTEIGGDSFTSSTWPTSANTVSFLIDFRGSEPYTIPAGRRLGVRVWVAASSSADVALLYDHPLYQSFLQINEAG